jgi:hypothetical protein
MNDNNETTETVKRPTHNAYWVKERDGKKADWRQIGVAWSHTDGKGVSISLDLQPLDGRVVLRLAEEKKG